MLFETFVSCSGACFFKGSFLYWVKPIMKTQYVYGWSIHDTIKVLRQDPDRFRFFRGFMISTLHMIGSKHVLSAAAVTMMRF